MKGGEIMKQEYKRPEVKKIDLVADLNGLALSCGSKIY